MTNQLSPCVLIVVPTYNRANSIIDTLKSVCKQTYHNWEVIILDNCSNDDTKNLIQLNFKKERRIKYFFYDQFVPLPENWCRAYSHIKEKHKYFKYLCSDDILHEDFLNDAVSSLEETQKNIFAYTSNIIYLKNKIIGKKRNYGFYGFEKLASLYFRNYLGCPSAMLLKSEGMIKINTNQTFVYAGDIFESLKYYGQKRKIIFGNKFLVYFRLGLDKSETNKMFGTKIMIRDKHQMRIAIIPKLYSGILKKISLFFAYIFYFLELIFFKFYNYFLNKTVKLKKLLD